MNEREFKDRTKRVALRVIRVVESLPATRVADVIGKQLLALGDECGGELSGGLSGEVDSGCHRQARDRGGGS